VRYLLTPKQAEKLPQLEVNDAQESVTVADAISIIGGGGSSSTATTSKPVIVTLQWAARQSAEQRFGSYDEYMIALTDRKEKAEAMYNKKCEKAKNADKVKKPELLTMQPRDTITKQQKDHIGMCHIS
jgi:hypothetical protein